MSRSLGVLSGLLAHWHVFSTQLSNEEKLEDLPAKYKPKIKQPICGISRCLCCLDRRLSHVGKRRSEQQKSPEQQKHSSRAVICFRDIDVTIEADGEVPRNKHGGRSERGPQDLDGHAGPKEDGPVVDFGRTLTSLV
jgi:hypothetical protein